MSAKQGGIKYRFKSLLYDQSWDWTSVSRTIGEHSTYKANEPVSNTGRDWYLSLVKIQDSTFSIFL